LPAQPSSRDQALDSELHRSIRSEASLSTGRRIDSISSNCSSPGDQRRRELHDRIAAVVGAADQPARYSSPERKPRSSCSDSSCVERLLGVLVLDQLDRLEVAGAAHVADDRQVAQALEHLAEAPSFCEHVPHRSSRSITSMFASATAQAIGCPPKVKPWLKIALPCRNGSAMWSPAISAPAGRRPR
jgi:hypothetical protein